jgi:hypothetical protein
MYDTERPYYVSTNEANNNQTKQTKYNYSWFICITLHCTTLHHVMIHQQYK